MTSTTGGGFSVGVRDHIMIAHSLPDDVFGPARGLHGATYVVDAELFAAGLDAHGVVIDIGVLSGRLREVLADLNYSNLDDLPEFDGHLTTTEFLARHIHAGLARLLIGDTGGERFMELEVTLHESHVAWARYRGPLG